MVFLRTPFLPDSKTLWIPAETLLDCRNQLEQTKGVPANIVTFYNNGRRLSPNQSLSANATVDVALSLVGGKGGFGSMLRALGAQIEKTTNKEACRDLSGRRLRDINEETRLSNYVAQSAERELEKAAKKEAKMEKLRQIASDPQKDHWTKSKHEFHDPVYNKEREQATERVHEAIEQAFEKTKKKETANNQDCVTLTLDSGPNKRKCEKDDQSTTKGGGPAKKGLWMGVELTESDLESSSDSDEDVKGKQTIVKGEIQASVRP